MNHKKNLSIRNVSQILLKRGLITEQQFKELNSGDDHQASRLHSYQQAGYSRRFSQGAEQISPAEVISSFNLVMPGSGKILSEDTITEVIAQAAGLEYLKIDPLKLDLDIVTNYVSRPFALKNLIVPVEQLGDVVTVAVADPFNKAAIDDLVNAMKIRIKLVLASRSDIVKVLREFFGFRASITAAENEVDSSTDLSNLEQYVKMRGQAEIESTDKHIIAAVEFLLQYAFDQGQVISI